MNSYDVNSLYPASMCNHPLPTGIPSYFEGDGSDIPDLFGFVLAKVNAPTHLHTPILPFKKLKSNGSVDKVTYSVGRGRPGISQKS